MAIAIKGKMAVTAHSDAPARVIGDRYAIDREIGRGAMAVVYRARDRRYDRDVALKIVNPELAASVGKERFLNEIQIVARLNHPHIVALHDSGESDGSLFYVMPFIDGPTLRERLARIGKFPPVEAVHTIQQLASALEYAHRLGIVHRDIKPENVMFHQGEALITDFGISKALEAGGANLTRTGMTLGTPAYMSPEQAAADHELDGRSDQYSLACVLYEMIAGRPPFTGSSPQAMMAKRFIEIPQPIAEVVDGVSDTVSDALARALSREPSDRYPSTAEFAASLTTDDPISANGDSRRRSAIAVLPFANMSSDPESEYFTDGMTEEIINALSKVEVLDVVSRTSAFAFKGQSKDIREIGKKLNVGTVLQGSVRRSGQQLRVSAQLIAAHNGYHLWSERYDRELADVFFIQDEIAESIVKALRVVLTPGEARAVKSVPVKDMRAYEYYLRGRQLLYQHRRAGHYEAIEWYRRAIEIDPEYALAYAGIADSSSLLYMYREATPENLRRAEESSRKALELNGDLAEAHASFGLALSLRKLWNEAANAFKRALELDPRSFEAAYFYGRSSYAQGDFAKSEEMFARAARNRPDDYQAVSFRGMALRKLGRIDEALQAAIATIAAAERRLEINPGEARAIYLGAVHLYEIGQHAKAFEWADRAIAVDPNEVSTLYNIGCLYSTAGQKERALDCLDRAVRAGFAQREWIENDPDWDRVKDDERFKAIIARAGPVA